MKRKMGFGTLFFLFIVLLGLSLPVQAADVTIPNGVSFEDTNGNPVHAHGGGMIKEGNVYYWLGENRYTDSTFKAVSCYRSTDLKNWTFVNDVLTSQSASELNDAKIERPKVIYNDTTGEYVMWMHKENGSDYSEARAAVATSNSVCGDYTYHSSFRPLGYMSRDITLFKDHDGTGYMISAASNNADLHVYRLTSDYESIDQLVHTLWPGQYREAPAMFERNGTYFLVTSGATGWDPNQQKYATASSVEGTWSSPTNVGNGTGFDSQTAYVVPVAGSQTTSYLYLGDRWAGAWDGDVINSKYVWLPLEFPSNTSLSMNWHDELTVNTASGQVTGSGDRPIDTNAYYKIVNRNSAKVLDVQNSSTSDGAAIVQWEDNGATSQQWQFIDAGNGYYKIQNRNSGKILGVDNGSTSDGTDIVQWRDGDWNSQHWQIHDIGSGFDKIQNRHSGQMMDITDESTDNGAVLHQWPDTGGENQHWHLVKVQ